MLVTRGVRLTQPQGSAEIDWANPIARRGLRQLLSFGTLTEAVSGAPLNTSKTQIGVGGFGAGWTGNPYSYTTTVPPVAAAANTSVLFVCATPTSSANGVYLDYRAASYAGSFIRITSTLITCRIYDSTVMSFPVVEGVTITVVWRVKAGAHALYVNGVKVASSTSTANQALTPNYVATATTTCYLAGLITSTVFSDADGVSLSANPWQLFKPAQRRVYFDMGAGGGDGGTTEVTVEGTNSVQLSTSDSGYIGQEHLLVSSSNAQLGTLTAMGIAQANTLSGNPSVQAITSIGGAVTQISILSGEATASSSGTSQGVIQQVNKLLGADCLVLSSSSSAGLLQANNLVAISSAQLSLTTAAGILQSHVLLGGATFQSSYATSGGMSLTPLIELSAGVVQAQSLSGVGQVSQNHKLSHGQSEQPATSSNGATVQTHVLVSSNAVQFVLSSSEAIAVEERGLLQGSSVSQGSTITLGVILQGNILRGTSARQLTLSSSGAITQTGVLPPLTDAELREILAGMQLAIARLQVRLDAMY